MSGANAQECLWTSGDGYELLVSQEQEEHCRFYVVRDERRLALLEWEHSIRTVRNVCCVCVKGREALQYTLKLVWNDLHAVYCDYVSISGNQATFKTDLVIEVVFTVSDFRVVWIHGLVLIKEELMGHLHVFDTGHGRYLGYLTLYAGGSVNCSLAELMRYDCETSRLWIIARKYDELTKNSLAYLNTYSVPDLSLQTSARLPRGFTVHAFVKGPPVEGLELFEQKSATVYSSCELLDKTVVQWFISPGTPWREIQLDNFAPLIPAARPKEPRTADFQPSGPRFTIQAQELLEM